MDSPDIRLDKIQDHEKFPIELMDSALVPWDHGIESVDTVVERINQVRGNSSMILSVDSIRPQDLAITGATGIETLEHHFSQQFAILDKLPRLEGQIIIGSDPLSFMMSAQKNLDRHTYDVVFKAAVDSIAHMAMGMSAFEAFEQARTGETFSLRSMSRRNLLRMGGILSAGVASGAVDRFTLSLNHDEKGNNAESLFEGQGVGEKGQYAYMTGLDERTLLVALKQKKVREELEHMGYFGSDDVKSISVWGSDHFRTDNFNKLAELADDEGIAREFVKKGRSWLEKVLPEAKLKYVAGGGKPDDFDNFAQTSYNDLGTVSVVKVVAGMNGTRMFEPVFKGGGLLSIV